jgi:hypothetical protein
MKQVQCFLAVKTVLILFILLSFRLSAQVNTIPANISYLNTQTKPTRAIECNSTIESDSLESELRIALKVQPSLRINSIHAKDVFCVPLEATYSGLPMGIKPQKFVWCFGRDRVTCVKTNVMHNFRPTTHKKDRKWQKYI